MPQNEYERLIGVDVRNGAVQPAPASQNPYETFMQQEREGRETRLRLSVSQAAKTDPTRAAAVEKVARERALPFDVVARSYDAIKAQPDQNDDRYRRMLDATPHTAEWASTPANAQLSSDDLDKLQVLERTIKAPKITFATSVLKGIDQMQQAGFGFLEAAGELSGIETLTAFGKEGRQRNAFEIEEAGPRASLMEAAGWADFAEWAKATIGEQIPNMGTSIASGYAGAQIGTAVLPGYGTAIGAVVGAFVPAFVQSVGGQQVDIKERTGEHDATSEELAAVFLGGTAIAALDSALPGKIGSQLTRKFGKDAAEAIAVKLLTTPAKGLARRAAGGAVSGMSTEAFTEALQEAIGEVATAVGTGTPIDDKLASRMLEAGAAGALVGGLAEGATAAVPEHTSPAARARQKAEGVAGFVTAIGEAAAASKTVQRSPEAAQELVRAATAESAPNLYVPTAVWRRYWQEQGKNPDDQAEDLTGRAGALEDAEKAGAKLELPTDAFAVRIGPTEHNAFFAKEVSTDPDEMSLSEAEAFFESMKGQAAAPAAAEPDAGERIAADIAKQLEDTGMPADQAATQAEFMQGIAVIAERTGVDPDALFQSFGIHVTRQTKGEAAREPKQRSLSETGAKVEGGVPALTTKAGTAPAARGRNAEKHYTAVIEDLIARAKEIDPDVTAQEIEEAFDVRRELYEEQRGAASEDPSNPATLLRAIAGYGGINTEDRSFPGEVRAVKAGNKGGVVQGIGGVFRKRGLSLDDMLTSLHQDPAFKSIETIDQLLDRIDDIQRMPKLASEDLPGTNELRDSMGIDPSSPWWQNPLFHQSDEEFFASIEGLGGGAEIEVLDAEPVSAAAVDGPEVATQPIDTALQRLQSLEARTDASPDSRAVPFPTIPADEGKRLFAARNRLQSRQRRVKLADLIATQETVSEREVGRYISSTGVQPPADVLEHEGKLYLVDGTHRAAALWARGDAEISATVTPVSPELLANPRPPAASPDPRDAAVYFQKKGVVKRGAIEFRDGETVITLRPAANLSTFLHEAGHLYLEVFTAAIEAIPLDPGAMTPTQRQALADYGAILKHLGVESHAEIKTEHHEKFARSFEAYLREGKAPSIELRTAFARVRVWFEQIYRSMLGLGVKLNPEIRGVFDRMLASDQAIAAAEADAQSGAMFLTREHAGMNEAEWAVYQDTIKAAHDDALDKTTRETFAQLARERAKWWQEERAGVRDEVAADVHKKPVYRALFAIRNGTTPAGDSLNEGLEPVPMKLSAAAIEKRYRRKNFLRGLTAEGGIDPDSVAETFGFSSADEMIRHLRTAPSMDRLIETETDARMKAKHGDILVDGSMIDVARAAIQNDHRGDVLRAEQLALARKRAEVQPFVAAALEEAGKERAYETRWKEAEARFRIALAEGRKQVEIDALKREVKRLRNQAAAELKTERRERAYERRWFEAEASLRIAIAAGEQQVEIDRLTAAANAAKLETRAGVAALRTASVPTTAVLKDIARHRISQIPIGSIRPITFWAAAKRQGQDALIAAGKNDFDAAVKAKQEQRLSMELYRAAVDARDVVKETKRDAAAFFKSDESLAKRRNMAYVAAARAIVAPYLFPNRVEQTADALAALKRYDSDVYDSLEERIIEARSAGDSLTGMKFGSFLAMRDSAFALWELSRRAEEIEIGQEKLERDMVRDEAVRRLEDITPAGKAGYTQAATKWERAGRLVVSFRAALRRVESWADAVDGGDPNGVMRRYIWNPISQATTRYRVHKADVITKYLEITKQLGELAPGKIVADEIGHTFSSKAELLHAVLHTGNDSNKTKLLVGRGWGALRPDGTLETSKWDAMIARFEREGMITEADYRFAQDVWDLFDSLKPASQKAHRDMYGLYFHEITAREVVTSFGSFRGGYVPAIADPFLVTDAAIRQDQAGLLESNGTAMFPSRPTTGRGFTKSRSEAYNVPLALDVRFIPVHLDKVLRFINIEPAVKDVGRLVLDRKFRAAADAFDPTIVSDMLIPWLQRAASQRVQAQSASKIGRRFDGFWRTVRTRTGMNLMVGNVVNTLQQFTGISISAVKVKPRYLRSGLWSYMRGPGALSEQIAEKSAYMATRVSAQVVEQMTHIEDLLLQPSKYDKARQYAEKHGYILQQGTQNVVDLITWQGAYDQAIEGGADEDAAVLEADSVVRQTQGSFSPEDVSAFETASGFVRLFTLFSGYFNMQANLYGTEAVKIGRDMGLRKGAGRAFYVYAFGFAIPAIVSEAIRQAITGALDPDDDEGFLDAMMEVFFWSQVRGATALVPVVGPVAQNVVNRFNQKGFDDRISLSPFVTVLESALSTPLSVYQAIVDDGKESTKKSNAQTKKAIRDTLSLVGLLSGLPVLPAAKPLSYLVDAEPSGPVDAVRGLVSGR